MAAPGAGAASRAVAARGPVIGSGAGAGLANPGFTDTFGTAVDDPPGYGLNDSLTARQSGAVGVTYTRESGLWYQAPQPQPWYSQVNHVNHPGVLSFWLGTSAVRMDAPVVANSSGWVGAQAVVDPVTGDTASQDWSSLVFSTDPSASGYVASSGVALGVLVRSDGGIQVFQGGTSLLDRAKFAQPNSNGTFNVIVTYVPGQNSANINVNGATVTVPAPAALPASSSLFMGAYLGNGNEVSTLSDLSVSAVDRTGLTLPASSGLRYYGYYAARLTGDSHLPEVAGRSNLNWVNISDVDGYVPDVLGGCAPGSCVVNTGNEFFSCDSSGNHCSLYPNYQARWANLAAAVRPYLNKIAAFYILDEPQWRGATPAEIQTSAELIKSTFPGKKVMMIEAGPEVTSSLVIPSAVDWVGFDWYCQPFAAVEQKLGTLESLTATSGQGLFLVPEDAPLSACAGVSGHQTDADIAALQWQYFGLAENNPRVIGLMNFGFWTSPAWTSGSGAASLPLTVDANERVAARILAAASGR
ncbi:MAG: hypothetical protein JOY82_09650 [Streptosporangiaceae bacterium]|nr:hypothetical protein [Streptosporangiaceae bacterium]